MTSSDRVPAGDVVVRRNPGASTPAFVLRAEPGPDQCGCLTLAAATQLAEAFARHACVDVWVEDAAGALSVGECFRESARRPGPVVSRSAGSMRRASAATA